MWPVIIRELRAEARRPFNYWLRVAGAAVGMLIAGISLPDLDTSQQAVGLHSFIRLHTLLLCGLLLCVPALVADCVSREKREGTLGLLFLTPLTATGIVVGKSVVQALRAVTLWMVLLPVVTITFLLGGVGWFDVVSAFALEGCALLLALAAGLLGSSQAKQWSTAVLLAEVYSVAFAFGFGILLCWLFVVQIIPYMPAQTRSYYHLPDVLDSLGIAGSLCTGDFGHADGWSRLIGFSKLLPGAASVWLRVLAEVAVFGLLFLAWTVRIAARQVEANWQDEPPTIRQLRWRRWWLTPRFWFALLFHWKQRRALNRNPIGWLQQYSVQARLIKWGACLFVVIAECLALGIHGTHWFYFHEPWQYRLLAIALAFSAAGSFRRERENGVLELILMSPVKPNQIISGRVRGLWGQFLPAYGVFFLAESMKFGAHGDGAYVVRLLADLLVLPIVGLYLSLRLKHFVPAWLLTVCVATIVPNVSAALADFLWNAYVVDVREFSLFLRPLDNGPLFLFAGLPIQIICGLAAWHFLHHRLIQRNFAYETR